MSDTELYVGASFPSSNGILADPAHLDALVDAATCVSAPIVLEYMASESAQFRFSRGRTFSSRLPLRRSWSRPTTATLFLGSHDPSGRVWSGAPYADVILTRSPDPQIGVVREINPADLQSLVDGVRNIFALLESPSAYLHISTVRTFAMGELAFTAMRPVDQDNHPEDTNVRIQRLGKVRSTVGPRVRGAYWGTLLSAALVAELGGLERVTRDAPVFLAEPLEKGGVYLQLTQFPESITTPAMQKGLPELERFLAPVLVASPPFFATGAAANA